jgi:hypothetical protein
MTHVINPLRKGNTIQVDSMTHVINTLKKGNTHVGIGDNASSLKNDFFLGRGDGQGRHVAQVCSPRARKLPRWLARVCET